MQVRGAVPPMPPLLRRASLAGGALAMVVVLALAANGRLGAAPRHFGSDIFDAQARALLHGDWDVPAGVVGGEGYPTDHGTQMYFGVFPALLRMPLVLVTDRFDGQLDQLSRILAVVLALGATSRLAWTARWLLGRGDNKSRREAFDVALLVLVTGAGSVLTFLASWLYIYTEPILWGLALALAALDQLVRLLVAPSRALVVGAGLFAGAALLTRVTVGAAVVLPLVGLAGIALAARLGPGHRWARRVVDSRAVRALVPEPGALGLHVAALAVVALTPLALYAAVNIGRFGHPWRVPYDQQLVYQDPQRAEVIRENGGSLFGPQFVATNLFAYVRPDSLRLGPPAPFVSFRDIADGVELGNARHDLVEPTSSVPATMPVLAILAIVGAGGVVAGSRRSSLVAVRLPLAAATLGALTILPYSVLSHRFLGDTIPLLVLGSAIGLPLVEARVARSRPAAVATSAALAALTVWSIVAGTGLALTQSRLVAPLSDRERVDWFEHTTALEDRLFGGATIPRVGSLPSTPTLGARIARPDCSRVYVGNGGRWQTVERAPGTGAFHLLVEAPPDDGRPHTLVRTEDGRGQVALRRQDGGIAVLYSADGGTTWRSAPTLAGQRAGEEPRPPIIPPGDGRVDLVVDFDWWTGVVSALSAGDTVLYNALRVPEQPAAVDPRYPGKVDELPLPTPVCDRLRAG